MYLDTSKCFQCNNHIRKGNNIYRGYDRTFCSQDCLSIQYNRISEFDPQFKSHYIWHSPNSEIQENIEIIEDISNTQPLKKRRTITTLTEINNLDNILERDLTILSSELPESPDSVLFASACSTIVPLIINGGVQITKKIYSYISIN
jgi:hypothetical protein